MRPSRLLIVTGLLLLGGGYGLWWADHGAGIAVMLISLLPLLALSALAIRDAIHRRDVSAGEILREQDSIAPSPWRWGDFGDGGGDGGSD